MLDEVRSVMRNADCLFDRDQVRSAISELAAQISVELSHCNPVFMSVMNGALVVAGELLTQLDFPLQVDYLHASRYRGQLNGGQLHWKVEPSVELLGRTVLIVDDILDEGDTLVKIKEYCEDNGARKVYTAVLIDKNHNRRHRALPRADFTGLDAPDRYLFGYGMDYKGYLRNAPGIYAVADT